MKSLASDPTMTNNPIVTKKEKKVNGVDGMALKDGTGMKHGVVPIVVSTEKNDKESKRKDTIVTNEPNCENLRKRKAQEETDVTIERKRAPVKYIGETSRSAYERLKEHYRDFENISVKSHMLKHYIDKHKDIPMKEMRFGVKVLRTYRSAFERQIGESVYINNNLKQGTIMMNSKNEYNRCIIPRLGLELDKDEVIAEYEENEKEIKREIQRLKEKMRYEKDIQKQKRRKLVDKKEIKEVNEAKEIKEIKGIKVASMDKKIRTIKRRERNVEKNWEKVENKLWKLKIRKKEKIIEKIGSQKEERIQEKLKSIFALEADKNRMRKKKER